MILYTEIVGGPQDGELISIWNNSFDALPVADKDNLAGYEKVPAKLAIFRYRKAKVYLVFNNQYYFREFFIGNKSDQDQAAKSFRNYFNPVFKKSFHHPTIPITINAQIIKII